MLMSENVVTLSEKRGAIELHDVEMEAVLSSLTTGRPVPAGYPFDASRLDFWPVSTPTGQRAVIGLAFDPDERPSKPAILVETVGGVLALALDRQHFRYRVNDDCLWHITLIAAWSLSGAKRGLDRAKWGQVRRQAR